MFLNLALRTFRDSQNLGHEIPDPAPRGALSTPRHCQESYKSSSGSVAADHNNNRGNKRERDFEVPHTRSPPKPLKHKDRSSQKSPEWNLARTVSTGRIT